MGKKKVAIIVPIYRPINGAEKVSLLHLNHYLQKYDKFFLAPKGFNNFPFSKSGYSKVTFSPKYFLNVQTYSQLMLSPQVYQQFINYQYILIYQPDALVFSDQLDWWCDQDYDYIGAPNYSSVVGFFTHKKGCPQVTYNGGLSLRKVSTALEVIKKADKEAVQDSNNPWVQKSWLAKAILINKSHNKWLQAKPSSYPFNEDGFWSLEAAKYFPGFKMPDFLTALKFSFEKLPQKSFELNGNKLPFACHAWARYDRNFWLPYLLK